MTGLVGCGWIKEWERAKKTGDDASRARAAEALRSSHNWPVLKDMQDEGGWSDVFWETADKTAAGSPPEQYQGAIGCS